MPHRRSVLVGLSATGVFACAGWSKPVDYDAVVGPGHHASITAALAAAPQGDSPWRILVTAGTWRERVTIERPGVQLIGEGRDKTIIVFNASAGDLGPDGKPIGTFRTATVVVKAPDFTAKHITLANDFDYVGHMPKATAEERTGPSGSQAVALAVQDKADRTLLEDVSISGYQDTLFLNSGRTLLRRSAVSGNVDFIFGAGRAVFEECEILSRARPGAGFNGYVVAPDTDKSQPYGFVFTRCRLTKDAGVAPHSMALGRPWRRTGSFPDGRYGDPDIWSAATYLNCWMDDHIVPEGWHSMSYGLKGGGKGINKPEDARFFEFQSSGPGAGPASPTRRILTAQEAAVYDPKRVLEGWNP